MHAVDVSPDLISAVTDLIVGEVTACRAARLSRLSEPIQWRHRTDDRYGVARPGRA
jgi:hypothetical protein